MLKLLLVGFTKTNANVIQIFVEMTFKNVLVDSVIRDVNEKNPTLPHLTEEQRASDAFIIDFEGVGFDSNKQDIAKEIKLYTQGKPILFMIRQNSVMPASLVNYEWLTMPYTREQMNESIKDLFTRLQSINTTQKPPTNLKASDSELTKPNINYQAIHQLNSSNPNILVTQTQLAQMRKVFEILSDVFSEIESRSLFEFAKQTQLSQNFLKISINHYELYFNPLDKSIIAMNVDRITDNFMAGLRKESILFHKLEGEHFRQKATQELLKGASQYSLSQFIWLVGIEMIQAKRYLYAERHELKFEAKYMPNILGLKNLPKYIVPVIASCLGRARSLSDFNAMFPQLSNAQINQVLILLTISQGIHAEALINSVKPLPVLEQNAPTLNTGVKKAHQTGFLKRLLNLLGM